MARGHFRGRDRLIDIRYHIYSIAAIFLALAVGIVIGTSFAKSFPSDASGRHTIQRYEQDMRVLREAILQAHDSATKREAAVKAAQEYCRALMPAVVSNKLSWRNVVVVQTGDSDDLTGSVKQALALAGAQVVCTVDINSDFAFADHSKIKEALTGLGLTATGDSREDRSRLFRVLGETISTGKFTYFVPKLEKVGIANFSDKCETPCSMVVFVGGAGSEESSVVDMVDAELAPELAKQNVTAVGCEASDAKISYVPTWHKAGIATVDNADNAMGQTCLIYALTGEVANFGTKDTADRLIPKSLEGE
jgi:hypothetical protein